MRCSAGNCSASAEFFSSSESATKMREQIADECMNEEPWGESCRKIPEDTSFFFCLGGGENLCIAYNQRLYITETSFFL